MRNLLLKFHGVALKCNLVEICDFFRPKRKCTRDGSSPSISDGDIVSAKDGKFSLDIRWFWGWFWWHLLKKRTFLEEWAGVGVRGAGGGHCHRDKLTLVCHIATKHVKQITIPGKLKVYRSKLAFIINKFLTLFIIRWTVTILLSKFWKFIYHYVISVQLFKRKPTIKTLVIADFRATITLITNKITNS